jgi:hypothetical protein
MYKQNTMTQEQLRMQMLAGIITEGQYKAKLNEANEELLDFVKSNSKEIAQAVGATNLKNISSDTIRRYISNSFIYGL